MILVCNKNGRLQQTGTQGRNIQVASVGTQSREKPVVVVLLIFCVQTFDFSNAKTEIPNCNNLKAKEVWPQ